MNKFSQTEILEALNQLNQPKQDALDLELLNKVERQVWLSISKSLSEQPLLNSVPMPNNNTPLVSNNNYSKPSQKHWWTLKKYPNLVFLSSFVALVIIVTISFSYYFKTSFYQTQNNLVEPISLQEIRAKAEQRFVKLSNGISFAEFQKLNSTNQENLLRGPGKTLADSSINERLQKQTDPNNLTVSYQEMETRYFVKNANSLPFPDFDITKSIISKIWTSGIYFKGIRYYDGKIIDLNLHTPEYQISYMGGKYAIKGNYTKPYYLAGMDDYNYELEFLKKLLDPNNPNDIKDYGIQTVDNKKLRVIEIRYPTVPPSFLGISMDPSETKSDNNQGQDISKDTTITTTSDKYYFDQNDLSLYLTEHFTNNQLLMSQKILKRETLEKQTADDVFHIKELGNLPIKEYIIPVVTGLEDYSLVSFVQRNDVYFIPELGADEISYFQDIYTYNIGEDSNQYKYYYDPEFNPYLDSQNPVSATITPSLPTGFVANYSQGNVYFSIFKQNKPKYDYFLSFYGPNYYLELQKERDIQIELDKNRIVKGRFLELLFKIKDVDTNTFAETILSVEFKIDDYWYIMSYSIKRSEKSHQSDIKGNFDPQVYFSQEKISLSKLTLEQAKEIQQRKQQQQNNTNPNQSGHSNSRFNESELNELISQIPEDMLILPGDLRKEYNLVAVNISYQDITDPDYVSYLLDDCHLLECFIGYKKNLILNFLTQESLNSGKRDQSLIFIVLDLDINKLNFENLRRVVVPYHNNIQESEIPKFKDVDYGIKYITKDSTSFIFVPVRGKTVVIAMIGINFYKKDYLKIAQSLGLKKGLDEIKQQIIQYSDTNSAW